MAVRNDAGTVIMNICSFIRFIVPRSQAYDDECTFAVVTAQVERDLRDGRTFVQRLVKAVTEWVKTTDEGRAAWKCSFEDLNVGDLVHYVGDPSLDTILTRNGICSLCVQVFSEDYPSGWQFDDVLVDL